MKKLISYLAVILLTGCVAENSSTPAPRKPDYLAVFQAYQQTQLYAQCDEFMESISDTESEKVHHLYPFNVIDDMKIIASRQTEDAYVYDIACEVTAKFQHGAFYFFDELHVKELGEVIIKK